MGLHQMLAKVYDIDRIAENKTVMQDHGANERMAAATCRAGSPARPIGGGTHVALPRSEWRRRSVWATPARRVVTRPYHVTAAICSSVLARTYAEVFYERIG